MSNGLAIDEVDRPGPEGSRDVVVEIDGAGWCQTDNHIIEGQWADYVPQPLPMTLGHENAGTVGEVGEEVTLVSEGDKVICHPVQTCGTCRACRQGETMYCENDSFNGLTTDGGFADEMRTSERSVIPLPDGVDPTDIAPHADAGITAYHAVKKAVDELDPGDTAVVIGVGGLGHIGLQCLDAMCAADIVALEIKESARELAVECGADETTALEPDITVLGGEHHVIGYGGHVHEPAQAFVAGEFTFRGTLVGQYSELQELVALVDRGDVDLHTSRYGLEEINEVAEQLENREIDGRAVITP
jgi:propanol-preferring alcohol dehydrogenase